ATREAFLTLLRTAHEFERALAAFLAPHGLTATQYNVLRILRGARPEALPCRTVGARMVAPVPDVTRLLDRLERAGWVERRRDAADRRVVTARITPAGLDLLAALDEPLAAWHRRTLGGLDAAGLTRLTDLLKRARAGLADAGEAEPLA
ncbi:MAG: MarR family transcriptional regulator, partial [Thermoanaerobaculia bacterium]|nr:MarR family transcriptional regulator [Thermoanaerobaculia bacterium]